jgi:undecaprenyl-diphosphatase
VAQPSAARRVGTFAWMDWSLFHAVNSAVATRDWAEDPVTFLGGVAVPLYAAAIIALWFLARPYGDAKWKHACTSGLAAAAIAMITNQIISHLWERPRPFVTHQAFTHLLSAPSPDSSFPSDHAAIAFAIAFGVLAFSRRAGIFFLAAATLIGLSRIALGLHYPSDVLAGVLVGWTAALVTTGLGRPWIARLVSSVSKISDPLLKPVWDRLPGRLASLRR